MIDSLFEGREKTIRNKKMHVRYVEQKAHEDARKKEEVLKIIPKRRPLKEQDYLLKPWSY